MRNPSMGMFGEALLRKAGAWMAAGVVLAIAGPACATENLRLTDASFIEVDGQLHGAKGHPNEEWRLNGLKAYLSGHYGEAVGHFERAAGYADKYSQHYLSLIYWHGQGVSADPVQAYIWSDLAAERGSRPLLAIREKMWQALSSDQREQVVAKGQDFYARYGDDIAKPKADAEIRRFAKNMTGSRIGYNNSNIDIQNGGPMNGSFGNATPGMLAASVMVQGSSDERQMYNDNRIQLDSYWQEQDRQLDDRKASVGVGPLQIVKPLRESTGGD